MIANSYPQLSWVAPQPPPTAQNAPDAVGLAAPSPDQQQLNAISLDVVRQSVDKLATGIAASQERLTRSLDRIAASQEQITRSVDKIAASIAANQEQITHSVDRIAAGQEQMTRDITKLQEIEQYILYKNSESPPPQQAPAPARGRAPRPPQAPTTPTPSRNP